MRKENEIRKPSCLTKTMHLQSSFKHQQGEISIFKDKYTLSLLNSRPACFWSSFSAVPLRSKRFWPIEKENKNLRDPGHWNYSTSHEKCWRMISLSLCVETLFSKMCPTSSSPPPLRDVINIRYINGGEFFF